MLVAARVQRAVWCSYGAATQRTETVLWWASATRPRNEFERLRA